MYRSGFSLPDLKDRPPDDSKWNGLDHRRQSRYFDNHGFWHRTFRWTTYNAQRRSRVSFWCSWWWIIQYIENGLGDFQNLWEARAICRWTIAPKSRQQSFWLVSGKVIWIDRVVHLFTFSRSRHWIFFLSFILPSRPPLAYWGSFQHWSICAASIQPNEAQNGLEEYASWMMRRMYYHKFSCDNISLFGCFLGIVARLWNSKKTSYSRFV